MKIKLLSNWQTQWLPERVVWQGSEFTRDPACRDYDWLVVYDEMPTSAPKEELACPPEHTILITQEPPTIKIFPPAYTHQFNYVLTTHDEHELPHPHHRRGMGCFTWMNGRHPEYYLTAPRPEKTDTISAICTAKMMKNTEHYRRFVLLKHLQKNMPEFVWRGQGINPLNFKHEALDSFKYHVVVENFTHPYHWSEKPADAFLSYCLPFYSGDPMLDKILPPESFIRIPIDNPEEALAIIRKAIADGEYEKRLPAVCEARRRIVESYNLYSQVLDTIARHEKNPLPAPNPGRRAILGRRLIRRNPLTWPGILFNKLRIALTRP